jgi:hypothetical protein
LNPTLEDRAVQSVTFLDSSGLRDNTKELEGKALPGIWAAYPKGIPFRIS